MVLMLQRGNKSLERSSQLPRIMKLVSDGLDFEARQSDARSQAVGHDAPNTLNMDFQVHGLPLLCNLQDRPAPPC